MSNSKQCPNCSELNKPHDFDDAGKPIFECECGTFYKGLFKTAKSKISEPPNIVEFETTWGRVKCHDGDHVIFPRFMGDGLYSQLQGKNWRVRCEQIK